MKIGLLLSASALAVAAVAVAAMPLQDAKAKTGDDKAAMGGMDQAAMEAMMKAGAAGPEHAELKQSVGTWDLTVKFWMDPSAPPGTSQSTATREMALDGRFLIEKVKGSMGPMGSFEGLGILGFNNLTKQYDHIWMDSMSTGMMISHGTVGADGTLIMIGEYDDPMGGGKVKARTVTHRLSGDEQRFEMYENRGQGEVKSMEITYKRVAAR